MQYIIMCRSLTYAQRAERLLDRNGIYAGLTKAPQGITPEGCTFGVKLQGKHIKKALAIVRASGIKVGKVYVISQEGRAEEVKI